jgi:hypothetical protein
MKYLLVFFISIFPMNIWSEQIIIGNVSNCPFSIVNAEFATVSKGSENTQNGKAYEVQIYVSNYDLESITISAIVVDGNGIVKGMDSRNFKGNFNSHRTYKVIINDPSFDISDSDKIYIIPYYSKLLSQYWLLNGESVLGFLSGGSSLEGIIVNESPPAQPAPSKCTPEQLSNICSDCSKIALNLCGAGNISSFKCTCEECSFSCHFGDGGKK